MTDLRRLTVGPERISPESMKPVKCFANIIDADNLNEPTRVGGTSGSGIGAIVGSGATRRTEHVLCKLPPGIMVTAGQLEVTTDFTYRTSVGASSATSASGVSLWMDPGAGGTHVQLTEAASNSDGTIITSLADNFIRDTDTGQTGKQPARLRYSNSPTLLLAIHQTAGTPAEFAEGEAVIVLQFVEYRRRDECGQFEVRTRATDPEYFADR